MFSRACRTGILATAALFAAVPASHALVGAPVHGVVPTPEIPTLAVGFGAGGEVSASVDTATLTFPSTPALPGTPAVPAVPTLPGTPALPSLGSVSSLLSTVTGGSLPVTPTVDVSQGGITATVAPTQVSAG